jgi:hypothetical protein
MGKLTFKKELDYVIFDGTNQQEILDFFTTMINSYHLIELENNEIADIKLIEYDKVSHIIVNHEEYSYEFYLRPDEYIVFNPDDYDWDYGNGTKNCFTNYSKEALDVEFNIKE